MMALGSFSNVREESWGMRVPTSIQGKGLGALSLSGCFLKQKLLSLPGHCRSEDTLERSPWIGMERGWSCASFPSSPTYQHEQIGKSQVGKV